MMTTRKTGKRGRSRTLWLFLPFASLVLGASPGCSDPIQQGRIEALGKEVTGIPKGEFHRAGQPCVVCHSENGPASDFIYTIAGTIFAGPEKRRGVDKAEVRMTDSLGTKHIATTNCVGNFFVKPTDWNPKFPILVQVAKKGTLRKMNSVIGREPDCAACHNVKADRDPTSQLIHVFLFGTEEVTNEPDLCPVEPSLE